MSKKNTAQYEEVRPIETNYGGIKMRSRLEARWAKFFDFLGLSYKYEPFSLGSWLPDFELKTNTGKRVLVEVKPFSADDMLVLPGDDVSKYVDAGYGKALAFVSEFDILLLGEEPFVYDSDYPCVGVIASVLLWQKNGEKVFGFDYAGIKGNPCTSKFGISPVQSIWDDIIDNTVERKDFVGFVDGSFDVLGEFYKKR